MTDILALEAHGVSKRFGDREALRSVELAASSGQVHGLLGPNGAGKTTLLRILLGLVRRDGGDIRVLGRAVEPFAGPISDIVGGFVETPSFYGYLSGRENLELLASLDLRGRGEMVGVGEAIEQVGLDAHADAAVAGYSAGMRQRLGLAATLVRAPRVLLLDEPTSSLDPATARAVRGVTRRLADEGVAIVLSSHDMSEVEQLCSAVTIVDRGRVIFTGAVDELRAAGERPVWELRTSDDPSAAVIAAQHPQITVASAAATMAVTGTVAAVDALVIALGRAGIAVRHLQQRPPTLESTFLQLTGGMNADREPSPAAANATTKGRRHENAVQRGFVSSCLRGGFFGGMRTRAVLAVLRAESIKLGARAYATGVLAVCAIAPFLFVWAMRIQSSLPEDTLFGRAVRETGLATPLVVLGFGALWAFPVLASSIAGDLFSAEDRDRTWPALLTRSCGRSEVFAGKVMVAAAFACLATFVLAASSIVAGILAFGYRPLIDLSGAQVTPAAALGRIVLAWTTTLPPSVAFAAMAVLVSIATRSSAAGIALPVVTGLAMQLALYVDAPEAARRLLLSSAFDAWHGLLTDQPYYRPLIDGVVVSAIYCVSCLAASYALLRNRDMTS